MSHDPIDDYLQALIGEAVPAPAGEPAQAPAGAHDQCADAVVPGVEQDALPLAEAPAHDRAALPAVADPEPEPAASPVTPEPALADAAVTTPDPADALLAELDAAFDQARDAYEQNGSTAAAVDPADALLAELDAAFDQARDAYEQNGNTAAAVDPADALLAELDAAFDQARDAYEQNGNTPAAVDPADALLAELDAAFDQARDAYEQNGNTAAAVDPADALLAELDAAFDQARAAYEQNGNGAAAPDPADALLAELDAAFDQARDAYQQQAVAPATAPAVPAGGRRIPPAPIGPPVLAARPSVAQPVWQARNPAAAAPAAGEPRRRANERVNRWLRLRCDAQPYALELLKVQEVVLPTPLLSLRGTPAHMLGIMNLRGQVVPVMDLGIYLGREPAQDNAATRIVVLESEGQSLGLRVSAVEDVASLSDSQIEPPDTARLCRFSNHLFRGMARLGGMPMILLDADALLN